MRRRGQDDTYLQERQVKEGALKELLHSSAEQHQYVWSRHASGALLVRDGLAQDFNKSLKSLIGALLGPSGP